MERRVICYSYIKLNRSDARHSKLLADLQSSAEANNAGLWSAETCSGKS